MKKILMIMTLLAVASIGTIAQAAEGDDAGKYLKVTKLIG